MGPVFAVCLLTDFEYISNLYPKVRKDTGHEGVVLYFMDSSDNVIGLLKKKTVW
jgi:hypothetical protein